ncbi:MAG: SRPBCC family protein [Gomphosphaeria aponina SAG 52.96 = DSM 107014]|uniref:SRPBCC family protein n=1 Tax=Gomphosphaeria aponina SAG 52.96 = DSM 107014 TaxID=1521640 RepID=A0A941GQU6_9CHRO|nr:SRPBCC family protein [Gomphosphaeria aponina SAG 52.96 = DSM 107014]
MSMRQIFAQSIEIKASAIVVEKCITDRVLMHRWLNPMLRCEPIGAWNTEIGGRSRFIIKIPVLEPTLNSVVRSREPGLIVWEFEGFFQGCDRWECQPTSEGTHLVNCFEFAIPNPLVSWGFNNFAATFTKNDMKAQLRRLKRVAEEIYHQQQ